MADCSIDGCGKARYGKGWCKAHYRRWKQYGDPLGGGTTRGSVPAFLENTVLPFEGEECLIWPYAKSIAGYGKIRLDGKLCDVHRIVCEHEHGPPPTPKHHAAHLCGKGHEGCCNRKHLEWKTPGENEADKLVHGTSNRGERCGAAKLTQAQVIEIRSSTKPSRDLAGEYGISKRSVVDIKLRKTWAWLEDAA